MPAIISATTSSGLVTSADNSGSLQLATNNGTTAVTIDTSQNVGIGTASPSQKLHIRAGNGNQALLDNASERFTQLTLANNGTTKANFNFDNTNNVAEIYGASGSAIAFSANAAERMRVDSSGRLLVNRTVTGGSLFDSCRVQVTGNISVSGSDSEFILQNTGSDARVWRILSASGGGGTAALRFYDDTANIERMRIDTSGRIYFSSLAASAGTNALRWSTSTGQVTYDTSSARYKNNIRDSVYGLNHVMQMRSTQFEYKDDNRSDIGLIAEELQPIVPELVGLDKDGQADSVSYDRMVSVLVKAIQELNAKVDAQALEIQALKGVA